MTKPEDTCLLTKAPAVITDPRALILLLHGPAQSGKDTAALHLATRYGFVVESFARPLKTVVHTVFGIPYADMEDGTKKATALPPPYERYTPRALLQLIGTELFRQQIDRDVWVHALIKRVTHQWALGYRMPIVITDCRFPNELTLPGEWLPQYRSVSVKLVRNIGPLVGGIPGHASEQSLCCDYQIHNTGTIADLHAQLDAFVQGFGCLPTLLDRTDPTDRIDHGRPLGSREV